MKIQREMKLDIELSSGELEQAVLEMGPLNRFRLLIHAIKQLSEEDMKSLRELVPSCIDEFLEKLLNFSLAHLSKERFVDRINQIFDKLDEYGVKGVKS